MNELPLLGQYIKEQLRIKRKTEGRIWTQNELARRSGLSSGGLSMVINGKVEPTASTLKSIADALSCDVAPLLKLAGIIDNPEDLDSSALKIAKRITNLPKTPRRYAVSTIESLLDTIYVLIKSSSEEPITDFEAEIYPSLLGSQVEVLETVAKKS